MNLQTFKAPSMAQALAQVKRNLGSNAVIVQTRSYKHGGIFGLGARKIVEITARKGSTASGRTKNTGNRRLQSIYNSKPLSTIPAPPVYPEIKREGRTPMGVAGSPDTNGDAQLAWKHEQLRSEISDIRKLVENMVKEQRQLHEPQMPEKLFDLYLTLIQREVADEIAREMIQKIQQQITGNQALSPDVVRRQLIQVMDSMIHTTGPICPNLNGKARVVALIGPTGVGKTTTIAKIAANLKLRENKNVGLITIDTYRIGAIDQLRMYAQIIDVPIKVVLTPAELKEAVASMEDMDVVLIDTAGRSQNDQLKLKELKTFMQAASPDEIHLVLSGNSHHSHMLSAAEKFKTIGVDRIILTKLDEAVSFGVILSVLRQVNASISYVTTGQDVPDDIEVGNGRQLAQRLLGINEMTASSLACVSENLVS